MQIHIITLFPDFIKTIETFSVIGRAISSQLVDLKIHDLRKYGLGNYHQVDDTPFGGGAGMVMMPEPIVSCLEDIHSQGTKLPVIALSAAGSKYTQSKAEKLSNSKGFILLCGHFEGIDQRVIDNFVDEELSIGEYVLSGGELPALVVLDSVTRLIPGVLGSDKSLAEESFSETLDRKREYPHYTRPADFRGLRVPDVLLSGNHQEIAKWRKKNLH